MKALAGSVALAFLVLPVRADNSEIYKPLTFEKLRNSCKPGADDYNNGFCTAYIDAVLAKHLADHQHCTPLVFQSYDAGLALAIAAADLYEYPKEAFKAMEMIVRDSFPCRD